MFKLLTIVGARPHFIKATMVSKAIQQHTNLREVIVHTGQHYDQMLSDVFFQELDLPEPAYHLGVGSQRAVQQTARIMMGLDEVIQKEKPDMLVVYGDTNSTAAGAIAAAQNQLPLAHVEAGLREFDKRIPEEVNKLLTDAVADLYFCPTKTGVDNLAAAGITKGVHWVGDVGIDLIQANLNRIQVGLEILEKYRLQKGRYYLMTCHRAANTNQPERLKNILLAINQLDLPVIWPIHPRTRKAIEQTQLLGLLDRQQILVVPPLGFWDLQSLLCHAKMVLTDSGGIIKEAYFHRVPGIIIDDQTEWVETVEEGWNRIAGAHTEKILEAIHTFKKPHTHTNCLGDGTASQQVVSIIDQYLNHAE